MIIMFKLYVAQHKTGGNELCNTFIGLFCELIYGISFNIIFVLHELL